LAASCPVSLTKSHKHLADEDGIEKYLGRGRMLPESDLVMAVEEESSLRCVLELLRNTTSLREQETALAYAALRVWPKLDAYGLV